MNFERVGNVPGSAVLVRPNRRLRVNNVANRLGVTCRDVRYLAGAGKLPGFKVGKLWFFWESDVIEYQKRNRPRPN
jgi:excisionase family DNA binding protein